MLTDHEFIDFTCPYCRTELSYPTHSVGHLVPCTNCAEPLIVPEPGVATAWPLPLPLETPRLKLRRLRPTDWKDLLRLLSDQELFRYLDGGPLTEQEVLQWLDADSHIKLTTPGQPFNLGIEFTEAAQVVGCVCLRFGPPARLEPGFEIVPAHAVGDADAFFDPLGGQVQLSVLVHPAHQRKGIGTEAATAALDFCFLTLGVHRVVANCAAANTAAISLCKKLRMRHEATHVKAAFLGEWHDILTFAILADEYVASSKAQA